MTWHRSAGRKVNAVGAFEAVVAAGCKAGRIGAVNRSDVASDWSVQLQDGAAVYSVYCHQKSKTIEKKLFFFLGGGELENEV